RDSDVFYPYNTFVKEKSFGAPQTLNSIKSIVKNKTKLVAWFVSNCQTSSRRELYVRELQKYLAVDIYGSCGDLKCQDRLKCRQMLHDDYKFYLAFENSNCKDYVTEKFTFLFEPRLYILPIVMWKKNYENYAPPRSFISIEDFESPKALAEYLLALDKNLDEYAKYFLYKNEYRIDSCRSGQKCGICRLCQMALEWKSPPDKRYIVENIDQWWNAPDVCDNGLIRRILKS
uniref:Fucosyltransferase n=1 Tax=Romanomermis culicivorax TaxID=13658 RepID=A0A915L171_ROMCU